MLSSIGRRLSYFLCCPMNRSKSCEFPTLPSNFVPVLKPKQSDQLPSPLFLRLSDISNNDTRSDSEDKELFLSPVTFDFIKELSAKRRVAYSQKVLPKCEPKSKHSILSMLKIRRKYSQQ